MQFVKIHEVSDVYIDAGVKDNDDNLIFLSAWGCEARIQEFRARLSLPTSDCSNLNYLSHAALGYINISNKKNLESLTSRVPQSLFDHLTHLWVYDKLVIEADYANRRCIVLTNKDEPKEHYTQRVWHTILSVSHIPMLPNWQSLLDDFINHDWMQRLKGFGGVDGYLIDLGSEDVESFVSEKIRLGDLSI